jgi:hypothetical protein
MSSLWRNVVDLILRLLYVINLLSLDVLSDPPHSPYTPSTDCAHLSFDYVNSFTDYNNTSTNYDNKFDDCVNTPND